jgi:hypothetical protein
VAVVTFTFVFLRESARNNAALLVCIARDGLVQLEVRSCAAAAAAAAAAVTVQACSY